MQLTKHWAATLDDYVIDLAWAPGASHLAAASAAGPVSIFSNEGGALLHALPGHDAGTNCLAWMPVRQRTEDGGQRTDPAGLSSSILATGGQDGAVKFWDVAAGQHTATAK